MVEDDKVINYFFELLSASLDDSNPIPAKTLTGQEWYCLYEIAKKQSVAAILTVCINKLDSKLRPPKPLLIQWLVAIEAIKKRNIILDRESIQIQNKLSEKGIRSCLLKGQGVASYYPNPLLRTPGDIDLWINCDRENFVRYIKTNYKQYDIKYRDIDVLTENHIEVEYHFTPAIFYNIFKNKTLQDFFQSQKETQLSHFINIKSLDEKIAFPTRKFNCIYLLIHIFSHYLYEGIGLKQFIDYYYLLKTDFSKEERIECVKQIQILGLEKFAKATMYILTKYLGLENRFLLFEPNKIEGERLIKNILISGNMGLSDPKNKKTCTYSMNTFLRHIYHNIKFINSYPSEVIYSPFFKIWHFYYRKSNNFL